jgi:beta-lactamase class A
MRTPFDRNRRFTARFFSRRLLALFVMLALGVVAALTPSSLSGPFSRALAWSHTPVYQAAEQRTGGRRSMASQQPGQVPESASIDALSSSLSSYLTTRGSDAGVEVYDVTHQHSYASHGTAQFLTASSIKVPVMLTFFAMTESQGRKPDDDEMKLLTAMIEHSDNDAASALFDEIGGASGMANYLQQSAVSGLTPNQSAWGYSLITPQAMVNMLTQLDAGTILTADDRATALDLMQHVEAGQQWGVGDAAPAGSTVTMKNGWVPGPDGLWSVNTSGIVKTGSETYIISVYTQEQLSLADGQATVQQICDAVASSLA